MQSVYEKIYAVCRQIPAGSVATYGMVAEMAGNRKWARVVGYALHRNPAPWGGDMPREQQIPCHRVVNRRGATSAAFAFGGKDRQRELLEAEGVTFHEDGTVRLSMHLWEGIR